MFQFRSCKWLAVFVAVFTIGFSTQNIQAQTNKKTAAEKKAERAAKKEAKRVFNEAKSNLESAFQTGDSEMFITAIEMLVENGTDKAIDLLLSVDASQLATRELYDQYATALSQLDSEEQIAKLIKIGTLSAKKNNWQVTIMFLDILAPHLNGAAQDFFNAAATSANSRIRVNAIRKIVAATPTNATVKMLIDSLQASEKTLDLGTPHVEASDALERMTNQTHADHKGWESWYDENSDFEPDAEAVANAIADEENDPRKADEKAYYDIPVTSSRIVFIIDTSGSMTAPITGYEGGQTTRLERAKHELGGLLRELPDSTAFNIISFNTEVSAWQNSGMLMANEKGVMNAVGYVANLQTAGRTSANQALTMAIEFNAEADTIYFLTDGAPSDASPEQIIANVEKLNRFQRAKIHCIGLGGGFGGFLQALADQNDGEFKLVN